jgi:excinuclease ABC subunit C
MSTPDELLQEIKNLSSSPGIYRMFDESGVVLYVGKARNLRNRVKSYFRQSGLSPRIASMMSQVRDIDVTVTHTENEALLLENNIIKKLHPRYNILLRDDKSYPFIFLSEHEFPGLEFHRGAKRKKGKYFGPYPSSSSVRETLSLLQKLFGVRQCQDIFFKNRSRPCLQYQIKRCSAPCVNYIDQEQYQEDIRNTILFLEGKSREIVDGIVEKMEQVAANLDYEMAARYRDQIAALGRVQEQQYISSDDGDADVLAVTRKQGVACVAVTYIRAGRNLGSNHFFPKIQPDSETRDILSAFLSQYYVNKPIPREILLSEAIEQGDLLVMAFSQQQEYPVTISWKHKGPRKRWIAMTQSNADDALRRRLLSKVNISKQFEALRESLGLAEAPERIECFDISHTFGELPVASCVVFDQEGAIKSDYRRFNIENIQASDDYEAMRQALSRRYQRIQAGEGSFPDLLLIDGGIGQVNAVAEVLLELQIADLMILGIAKGSGRKAGKERLFLWGRQPPIILPPESPALHLLQQIRDEAHRFAITGHRQRRARARNRSPLEDIPGVGDKRRQALLKGLGGLQEVARAGVGDLARIPGISGGLAQRIYDEFHND